MKTIRLTHPHQLKKEELPQTVLALGYFDGIHLGHQRVIKKAKEIAEVKGWASAVMSFHPHPSVVLGSEIKHVSYLTPLEEKEKLLEEMGIDLFYIVQFDEEFASLPPEEFVEQYIVGLNAKHVVAGFDFTYGRFGKGNMATLAEHARGRFLQTMIEKVEIDCEKVSSTMLRLLLKDGAVEKIPKFLNRYYSIKGKVVHGEKRGATIGFPTANIQCSDDYLLPQVGVYIVQMKLKGERFNGIANIGFKPTFHEEKSRPTIEVHLFEFNKQIYGEAVEIFWLKRLREEKKFASVDALIKQLNKDKEIGLKYFS